MIRRRRLRVFALSRAHLSAGEQANRLIENAARIEAELSRRGPFVYVIRADGLHRVFP